MKKQKKIIPVTKSQYLEWVYLGRKKNVITGIVITGIHWNIMHNLRSLYVLQETNTQHSAENSGTGNENTYKPEN